MKINDKVLVVRQGIDWSPGMYLGTVKEVNDDSAIVELGGNITVNVYNKEGTYRSTFDTGYPAPNDIGYIVVYGSDTKLYKDHAGNRLVQDIRSMYHNGDYGDYINKMRAKLDELAELQN